MSSEFSRSNLDHFLYLIAKEYKKQNRKNPNAELILIGGSSVIINYGFRDMTTDVDSIINASSNMKDIINKIADEQNLDKDWLNDDFKKTASYSSKLSKHSKFYKRFYNCLDVRTINDEYLIAMKLRSGREYKHDISDIIGIIKEISERGDVLTVEQINSAYTELYNDPLPEKATKLLNQIFSTPDYEDLYYSTVNDEAENHELLIDAQEKYKDQLNQENVSQFLQGMKNKKNAITDT